MNRAIQRIFSFVLFALFCVGCCSCGSEPVFIESQSIYCEYDQLSSGAQALYDQIMETAAQGATEFSFADCSSKEIDAAFHAVTKDHPELFWLGNGYTLRSVTNLGGTSYTLEALAMDSDRLEQQRAELDSVVGDVVSRAANQSTAFEKLLYLHDYIVDHTRYDQAAYELITSGKADKEVVVSSTAYGCLVSGQAVCSGYSAAFQLLAQKLGFSCGRVSGSKIGGGDHEWNYIFVDGDAYFIDVTWDDPVSQNEGEDLKSYEYFCIDQAELELTHTISGGQNVPKCEGVDLNYYRYNGFYLDEYSFDAVRPIFEKQSGAERVEIKFGSKEECEKAKEDLIDRKQVFELNDEMKAQSSVSYSIGDTGLIFKLYR